MSNEQGQHIPQYLVAVYQSSNFPRLGLSLQKFLEYSYVNYLLIPNQGRSRLSYEAWLEGFSWTESAHRQKAEAANEHS